MYVFIFLSFNVILSIFADDEQGGDVFNPVLRIRYENGLKILANGKQDQVWTCYGADGTAEFSNTFNSRGFSQWVHISFFYYCLL